ncbi:MAG: hypothetical protein D6798_19000 [Deltaproteobacteria bacterium]|nr:MAG: hypothetical protein D6798_19000 [Deltaproteobacteria bacterium]
MHPRATIISLATLALGACGSDTQFIPDNETHRVISPGEIAGRVCDPSGKTWLQDAQVYTHIKAGETIIDTEIVYTDRDGRFLLEDLPGEQEYDLYMQYGNSRLLEQEQYGIWVGDGERVEIPEPDCFDPLQIDVAIISGSYDSFELVLTNMGFANYIEVEGASTAELQGFLSDLDNLRSFDIIFFNGGHVEEDVIYPKPSDDEGDIGLGDGGAEDTGEIPITDTIMQNLRDYVSEGGSIYASDWSYDVVEQGWPDRIDFVGDDTVPDAAQLGEYDLVNAAVADNMLADWLDTDYIEIEYDLPVWAPIVTVSDSVSVHLVGNVAYRQGQATYNLTNSPLLVSFTSGDGKVVYSTFRVAKNASSEVLQTLQYMMYNL